MKEHLEPQQPEACGSPPLASHNGIRRDQTEADGAAKRREQRRNLLIGGVVAGSFLTLANQPARADGGGCTPSLVASQAPSASRPAVCGNSPGCWKNPNGYPTWADGATFMNVTVPYTHSTVITSVFPILSSTSGQVKFTINGSSLFGQEIDASNGITISITLSNGSTQTLLSSGQLSQLVAGLLNAFFFGNLYPLPNALTLITNFFTTVFNDAQNSANDSDISTQVNNLFGSSGSIYISNNNYSELCPP